MAYQRHMPYKVLEETISYIISDLQCTERSRSTDNTLLPLKPFHKANSYSVYHIVLISHTKTLLVKV